VKEAKITKAVSTALDSVATNYYTVFGLLLHSNVPLPGVVRADSVATSPDVELHLGVSQHACGRLFAGDEEIVHVCPYSTETEPETRVWRVAKGAPLSIAYHDGTQFWLDSKRKNLWATWSTDSSLEDVLTYLLGPVLGSVLRLRGTVCLHASAVAFGDRAIALVGSPGAGKSTTAAAFAFAGFPVLSDDVVALVDKETQFFAQPGYPRVNLWPDSTLALFGSEDALPRITPTWDKRYMLLGQNGHRFGSEPLPLAAIYILDRRDAALTTPVIEEVSCKEAFIALVANTYVNYLLDQDMRCTEFNVLGRMVSEIPVRRVRPPAEASAIFDLCKAITGDAKRAMACVPTDLTSVHG